MTDDRRPPYQQNDYIGSITRANRHETQHKRLNQMLSELKAGDKYKVCCNNWHNQENIIVWAGDCDKCGCKKNIDGRVDN